jgi:formate dehydrogenase maturation protein FdhE
MAEADPDAASFDVVVQDASDPYLPVCPLCQQRGRKRATSKSGRRYFVCAFCEARWIVTRGDPA